MRSTGQSVVTQTNTPQYHNWNWLNAADPCVACTNLKKRAGYIGSVLADTTMNNQAILEIAMDVTYPYCRSDLLQHLGAILMTTAIDWLNANQPLYV